MGSPRFSTRLIIFIIITLILQVVIIALRTKNLALQSHVSKAETVGCPYANGVLPVGSNIAANNNPSNYQLIRQLYELQNPTNSAVQNCFIPVTVVYDLFFLKGDASGIQSNLQALKDNKLFPIIRVASYTSGATWIKLYPPTDAIIMGKNLGEALKGVSFPRTSIITYLNEVNLDAEWQGKADAGQFAESVLAFSQGLKQSGSTNYSLYFPALSYGTTAGNGIDPPTFMQSFRDYMNANSQKFEGFSFSGMALNIYGESYDDIATQYNNQLSIFYAGSSPATVITELGPVRNGAAVSNCESEKGPWQSASNGIAAGVIQNNLSLATMACFGSVTYPAIVHYDGTDPQLVSLNNYGSVSNTSTSTTTTTTNQTTQRPSGTATLTFTPANPNPGDTLSVTSTSSQGLIWVNLAGKGPSGELINLAGKTPTVTKNASGYHWTYTIENVKAGTYSFVFSNNCDLYNTVPGKPLADICNQIGTGSVTVGQPATEPANKPETTTTTGNRTILPIIKIAPPTVQPSGTITVPAAGTGQVTFLKNDLNKIASGGTVDLSSAQYCNTTGSDRTCKPAQITLTNDTVTISYPNNQANGFCFNLINNPDASLVCF